jgi:hypothetical protein
MDTRQVSDLLGEHDHLKVVCAGLFYRVSGHEYDPEDLAPMLSMENVYAFVVWMASFPSFPPGSIMSPTVREMMVRLQNKLDSSTDEGRDAICADIAILIRSYFFDKRLHESGITVETKSRDTSSIIRGGTGSGSTPYSEAEFALLRMAGDNYMASTPALVNTAANKLRSRGIVKSIVYDGWQRGSGRWSGVCTFFDVAAGGHMVFITPYMQSKSEVVTAIAAYLYYLVAITDAQRVGHSTSSVAKAAYPIRHDMLRGVMNTARQRVLEYRMDPSTLALVRRKKKGDKEDVLGLRTSDQAGQIAIAFYLSLGAVRSPEFRLTEERVAYFSSDPNYSETFNQFATRVSSMDRLTDILDWFLDHLARTALEREANPDYGKEYNHAITLGTFSSNSDANRRTRQANHFRSYLSSLVVSLRDSGYDPRTNLAIVEWYDEYSLHDVLPLGVLLGVDMVVNATGGFVWLKCPREPGVPPEVSVHEMDIKYRSSGSLDQVFGFVKHKLGSRYSTFSFHSGGIHGMKGTHQDVYDTAVDLSTELAAYKPPIPHSRLTVEFLYPRNCSPPCGVCSPCEKRIRNLDRLSGVLSYRYNIEKPRYAYGHNSHFQFNILPKNGSGPASVDLDQVFLDTTSTLVAGAMLTYFRNEAGADSGPPKSRYHSWKLQTATEWRTEALRSNAPPWIWDQTTEEGLTQASLSAAWAESVSGLNVDGVSISL